MRLLAAPDKFRGTLPAREAAAARAAGAEGAGWTADERPLADGGEGTLDVLGGGNRRTLVSGPLGEPVEAAWRFEEDGTALIEAAQACGLSPAGGPERNDPPRATSRGVGELIAAAVAEGATRIVVTVGGVASTDGGVGATEAVPHPLHVPLEVACDVDARFLDAADVFAPQKGATPEQVPLLRERLEKLVVPDLPGSGAAGGLAGGLAAIGARLLQGFDLVADRVGLDERLAEADLVVTGEGLVDAASSASTSSSSSAATSSRRCCSSSGRRETGSTCAASGCGARDASSPPSSSSCSRRSRSPRSSPVRTSPTPAATQSARSSTTRT